MRSYFLFYFYCDYFGQSTTNAYAFRGGRTGADYICGSFCVFISIANNFYTWNFGATISFKPVILCVFYCDYFYQNTNTMNYARRGDSSDHGLNIGAFCIAMNSNTLYAGWGTGASISFK